MKQHISNLIQYYSQCIEEIKKEDNWKKFIVNKKVASGVCLASLAIFHIDIRYQPWIIFNYKENEPFWYTRPIDCWTKKEAIECLQFRVDKMKHILETWDFNEQS